MRVLYVRDRITPHDRRFIGAIIEQGHQAIVAELIGTTPSTASTEEFEHVKVVPEAVSELARDREIDVVQSGPLPTVAWLAARYLPPELPFVGVSWGSDVLRDCDQPETRDRALIAIDRANVLLVDCEAVQDRILSWRPTLAKPFYRFPWGIDLARYPESPLPQAADIRARLGWTQNDVFISTRAWDAGYGIDVLLSAFARVAEFSRNARLLLVGDGAMRCMVLDEIRRLRLSELVHTPGKVPEAQLNAWYAAADVYVSSAPCDGTSVSLLEAMASRLPAIAHERFGSAEWIRSSANGWLADVNQSERLADAMMTALRERSRWPEIGRTNRSLVLAEADWARNSTSLTEAYRSAIRAL